MRILIADSQSKVRNALRVLLRQQSGLEIVGEATEAVELLARVKSLQPDLVLVHWRLSGVRGEELLTGIRTQCPGMRVLALSARPESCQEALTAGVDAFVSKMDQPERLLATIEGIRQASEKESDPRETQNPADDALPDSDARRLTGEPEPYCHSVSPGALGA